VRATASTGGGSEQVLAYELVLTEHVDRWEIAHYQGAPEVVQRNEPAAAEAPEDDEPGSTSTSEPGADETTTTTSEDDADAQGDDNPLDSPDESIPFEPEP
jgi:hypothetical protein